MSQFSQGCMISCGQVRQFSSVACLCIALASMTFLLHGWHAPLHDFSLSLSVHSCVCAAMAMQNLASPMQLGFPISNYTMSLSLLERIDFWDTTEDAIGEDFHMFVKAYFKTHGQVRPSQHACCSLFIESVVTFAA